jgi:hypothetical protein
MSACSGCVDPQESSSTRQGVKRLLLTLSGPVLISSILQALARTRVRWIAISFSKPGTEKPKDYCGACNAARPRLLALLPVERQNAPFI